MDDNTDTQTQQPQPEPQPQQPAAPAPDATPAAQPAEAPANTGAQKKILLVEDDDNLASVYLTRLQAEGFNVRRVPNGEDALAAAMEYKPDLILLDVMMPKVSGFDVLDILRNTPETANIKIVMLTALSQDSDKQRASSLGVDDYLVKSQVVLSELGSCTQTRLSTGQTATASTIDSFVLFTSSK
ncbi:MAG: response regulator [Gammaproteobacteria bacterium]|nr:response regulator [Gammaproteobacteria bacterium]